MVSSLCHKELLVGPQLFPKRMLVDEMFICEPEQAEDIWIAFREQPDELADLVADHVPFADESLLNIVPAESDVMLNRSNEHTHEIPVIYAVGVGRRNIHVVGDTAPVSQEDDVIGQQFCCLLRG